MRERDTLVTVRTSRAERDLLNRAAAQRGLPVAQVVRDALARDGIRLHPDDGRPRRNTSGD